MTQKVTKAALERAKILFDLNGYYVVRNVLSPAEISRANTSINLHESQFSERKGSTLRNSASSTNSRIKGDGSTGRFDLGGILTWGQDSDIFKSFLCHPRLVPFLHLVLGQGYRLDHSPFVIKQIKGSEGFNLHGGPTRELYYHTTPSGEICNSLLGVSFFLKPQTVTDGGFCVVKGSHKSHFPLSASFKNGEDQAFFEEHAVPVQANAGDVVIFSEATVHGARSWENETQQRLIALYRFSPATAAHARGYLDDLHQRQDQSQSEDPKTPVVMQPPYTAFYDRDVLEIADDGELNVTRVKRNEDKKAFDVKVFGKEYY